MSFLSSTLKHFRCVLSLFFLFQEEKLPILTTKVTICGPPKLSPCSPAFLGFWSAGSLSLCKYALTASVLKPRLSVYPLLDPDWAILSCSLLCSSAWGAAYALISSHYPVILELATALASSPADLPSFPILLPPSHVELITKSCLSCILTLKILFPTHGSHSLQTSSLVYMKLLL